MCGRLLWMSEVVFRPLLLLDAASLLYRAYHSVPELRAPDGTKVHAAMGFLNYVSRLLPDRRPFLMQYYGSSIGQEVTNPLFTVTTKDRFGLVTVHGQDYQIVDIGMRMLEPHELFAAQGFPLNYIIDHDSEGNKISKAKQVARCGNAVPPPFAEHLVRANLPELCTGNVDGEEMGMDQLAFFNL